jgi:hypothetical protein
MAAKKSRRVKEQESISKPVVKEPVSAKLPKWHDEEMGEGEPLDPQEEKVLDWILKGVVFFILGWLALSLLLVVGGYFHLWG